MTGLGNTGKKFAIGAVDDFLDIESLIVEVKSKRSSSGEFQSSPIVEAVTNGTHKPCERFNIGLWLRLIFNRAVNATESHQSLHRSVEVIDGWT